MAGDPNAPHFPRSAPIDAYGKGGFAFAGMSHRGSLLCLPDAIWAWELTEPAQIDRHSLERVFAAANSIDTLLIGARTEDVESLTEFDEGPLPSDWAGELERRGIAVRCDILREPSREVLAAYGRNGPSY